MRKFKIISRDSDNYKLLDEASKKEYKMILHFFDIQQPQKGDEIALHENLLDSKSEDYSAEYYFGGLDNDSGRKIKDTKDMTNPDLLAIRTQDKTIILKRLYG